MNGRSNNTWKVLASSATGSSCVFAIHYGATLSDICMGSPILLAGPDLLSTLGRYENNGMLQRFNWTTLTCHRGATFID